MSFCKPCEHRALVGLPLRSPWHAEASRRRRPRPNCRCRKISENSGFVVIAGCLWVGVEWSGAWGVGWLVMRLDAGGWWANGVTGRLWPTPRRPGGIGQTIAACPAWGESESPRVQGSKRSSSRRGRGSGPPRDRRPAGRLYPGPAHRPSPSPLLAARHGVVPRSRITGPRHSGLTVSSRVEESKSCRVKELEPIRIRSPAAQTISQPPATDPESVPHGLRIRRGTECSVPERRVPELRAA